MDITPEFIQYAKEDEIKDPKGIEFIISNATELKFPDNHFDFITAFMSMMDVVDVKKALSETFRVLKAGGFFQFSITHPCFSTPPHRKHIRTDKGEYIGLEVGRYFQRSKRFLDHKLRTGKTIRFVEIHRTLADWLNMIIQTGYHLEYVEETIPSQENIKKAPHVAHILEVPDNLIIRLRKPI